MTTSQPTQPTATAEEAEALRKLAEAMIVEKLTTCTVVGHTSTGRVIVEHVANPGPAAAQWRALKAQLAS